jgi:hypothetical protein
MLAILAADRTREPYVLPLLLMFTLIAPKLVLALLLEGGSVAVAVDHRRTAGAGQPLLPVPLEELEVADLAGNLPTLLLTTLLYLH